MNFKPILRCNHDLKKNGYRMIRKLHKLTLRKNLDAAYMSECKEGYFFVLSCKNLMQLILKQYEHRDEIAREWKVFEKKSGAFLRYLETMAKNKSRINKRALASYLTAYTNFFKCIIKRRIPFTVTPELLALWNQKCMMAYYAVWNK